MGKNISLYLSDEELEELSKLIGSKQSRDISRFLKMLLRLRLKFSDSNKTESYQEVLQEIRTQREILFEMLQKFEEREEIFRNLEELKEKLEEKLKLYEKPSSGEQNKAILKALLELGRNLIVLKERREGFEKILLELLESNV
ncbi:MAG: hypothetical protein ACP5H3_03020 [Candidatus Aenigmatarchaeota archaeon]